MTITENTAQNVATGASFTVPAITLKKALAQINPAVSKYGALPVLQSIRADMTPFDGVTLTASDLDLTLTVPLEGATGTVGTVLLPYAQSAAAVSKVPARSTDAATVTASDGTVTITVGRLTSTIPQLAPVDEWPRKITEPITSDGSTMVDTVRLADVAGAMSPDDARPILAAVAFIGADMVATDSYRLNVVRGATDVDGSVLVPASAVKVAVKQKGAALLSWDRTTVILEFPALTIRARRVEGEFPNYGSLIRGRSDESHAVTFGREELRSAVAELAPLVKAQPDTPVRVRVRPRSADLSVTVQDVGTSSITVEADPECGLLRSTEDDPSLRFVFAANPRFLLALIAGTDGAPETVTLQLVDALKPIQTVEPLADGTERIRLLMPVRVS